MFWLIGLLACETVEYCTEEAHPSVTVSVLDYQGAPIQQALVFFSVDGSMEEEAILFDETSWVTTFDEPGNFRVRALIDSEYATDSFCQFEMQQVKEVFVDQAPDSCHIESQHLTFVFTPDDADCN